MSTGEEMGDDLRQAVNNVRLTLIEFGTCPFCHGLGIVAVEDGNRMCGVCSGFGGEAFIPRVNLA